MYHQEWSCGLLCLVCVCVGVCVYGGGGGGFFDGLGGGGGGGGGEITLMIRGWGCTAGTLKPLGQLNFATLY